VEPGNPLAAGNPLAGQDPSPEAASPEAAPANEANVEEVAAPAPTAAGRVAVSGPFYKHPLGFRFRYPEGWTFQPLGEDMLALAPPDLRKNAQGPTEAFLMVGVPAEGATEPGHRDVVNVADDFIRGLFPFLKRDGEVVHARHGGRPSAAITWKGKGPTGDAYTATMWITILEEAALAMTVVCPDDSFAERRPFGEAIFSTIHFEAPPRDEALVGLWRYEKTYMSGSFSAVTVRRMALRADGVALWGNGSTSFGMEHSDSEGGFAGSSTGSTTSDSELAGRWNSKDKRLYIVWESGLEEEFVYILDSTSMLLKPVGGGDNELWERRQ